MKNLIKIVCIFLLIPKQITICVGSALIVDSVPIINSNVLPSPEATSNVRFITVYMPAEALENPLKKFPCVYYLPGLGGTNNSFTIGNQNIMDDLIKEGQIEPFIIVHVDPSLVNGIDTDGLRRYQGSWYVNSALNGNFEDFMVYDLIPYVDAHYPTMSNANFRGIMGQSMGGYGSVYHGIVHPELYCAFAQASGTPFFLLTTNSTLVAPVQDSPGFEMFTFNSFILPEIPTSGHNAGKVTPDNGQLSFSIFSYAGAFSPNLDNPPYYVDLPFEVDSEWQPILVDGPFFIYSVINGAQINTGKSLIARPDIIAKWTQFDPYLLLDDHIETAKRQGIYHDGGSTEPLNAAGARLFSAKMGDNNINNEYLLFNGGHTTCLTSELCARHRTMLQLMSAQFAHNGSFSDDVRIKLVGKGTIELRDNAQCTIHENVIVGVETLPDLFITETDIAFFVKDNSTFSIGLPNTDDPGSFQIGNHFSKALVLADPSLNNHTVDCSLTIQGAGAAVILGNNSIFGIGACVEGNTVTTLNQTSISSLANLNSFQLSINQGSFKAQQVAPGTGTISGLLLIAADAHFNLSIDQRFGNLLGGCNILLTTDCIQRHPLSLIQAGLNEPGGIRNNIDPDPDAIDYFTKAPTSSLVYYTNNIDSGTLTSFQQLDDFYNPAGTPYAIDTSSAQELYDFLAINTEDDYTNPAYSSKEGTVGLVNGSVYLTYVDQGVIIRIPEEDIPLDNGQEIDFESLARTNGNVNIWVEEINGVRTLIRVDTA